MKKHQKNIKKTLFKYSFLLQISGICILTNSSYAAEYNGGGADPSVFGDSSNWNGVSPSLLEDLFVDLPGTTDLTVFTDQNALSFGVLQGTTNLTVNSGQTLTLSAVDGSMYAAPNVIVNLGGAGNLVGSAIEAEGTFNLALDATLSNGFDLASLVSSTGEVSQSGGTVTVGVGSKVNFGSGTGTYSLDDGTLEVGGTDGIQAGSGTSTFNLGGGTLRVVDSDLSTAVTPHLVTATNSTFDTNGFNAILENGLSGTGSFTKGGAGNMELGGSTTLSGTSTVEQDNLIIGSASAGNGDLTLNTGAALIIDSGGVGGGFDRLIVGDNATGVLDIDGGSINLKYYDGDGKTLRVGTNGGTGTVNMTDGSITVTEGSAGSYGVIVVGQDVGSTGTFNQSGGTIDQNGVANLQVGILGGTGTFTMTGDAEFIMGGSVSSVFFGYAGAGSDATINFSDNATFTQTADVQNFIADADSTAVFNQDGAGTVVTWEGGVGTNRPFWVGDGANGKGTYGLSAGSLTFNNNNIRFGNAVDSTGILNQTGGTLATPGSSLSIGTEGTGEYNISAGTADLDGIDIASVAGSTGTVDQTGGTVTITSGSKVSFGSGTGIYNLDGGTLEVGGTNGISGSGTLNLGGGTLKVVNSALTTSVSPTLTDGTTSTIDTNGMSLTVTSGLSGLGDLIKAGVGVLNIDGVSTNGGTTTVNAGGIAVNGTLSGSALTVDLGASLSGIGTVSAASTVSGALKPGNSPGLLTFTDGLTITDTGSAEFEFTANASSGRGTLFDGVDVTGGVLNIDPSATLELVFYGTGSTVDFTDSFWDSDQVWLLFDNAEAPVLDSIIFASIGVSLDSLGNSFSPGIGDFTVSTLGNDVMLNFTAVPEPAAFGLLLALASSLLVTSRRRRK